MTLDRLWAGWRIAYMSATGAQGSDGGCVLCRILAPGDDAISDSGLAGIKGDPNLKVVPVSDLAMFTEAHVVWRGETCAVVLNAYPYTSGHVMVVPTRHVGELEELGDDERAELWSQTTDAVRALKAAYTPEGLNVGINLGAAGGAGVPGHLHVHALPRWRGGTNLMTSVAEARVLPEPLSDTYEKVRASWPTGR